MRLGSVHQIWSGLLWRAVKVRQRCCGLGKLGPFRLLSLVRIGDLGLQPVVTLYDPEKEIRQPGSEAVLPQPEAIYPAIRVHRLTDVMVTNNRRLSAVLSGQQLILPDSTPSGPWNIAVGKPVVGGMLRSSGLELLNRVVSSDAVVPRGIFVGSWSPHNWFHWLIDTLPAVYLARRLPPEYDHFPVILAGDSRMKPAWSEPLQLVSGKREIVYLDKGLYQRVSQLLWIDSPTCPGPLPKAVNRVGNFSAHPSAMSDFREHILKSLALNAVEPARDRIFIARAQDGLRPYNQDEVLDVVSEYGFRIVYLERLNFHDSVKTLHGADIVVGAHGAGWANAIFCRPGTRGIMWTWEHSRNNWFENVAAVAGIALETIIFPHGSGKPYDVDVEMFRSKLESLIEQGQNSRASSSQRSLEIE